MAFYSFKKNCTVYIVRGSQRWKIEVYPDLTFSQTFDEMAHNVKTLHDQNAMFEEATINKANPANFSFTSLLVTGDDFKILGDWLANPALYDIYVDTGVDIFKITQGVLSRATFQIFKDRLLTVSMEGTASRLTRFGASGTTIPGTIQTRDIIHTPVIPRALNIELDGVEVKNINGLSLELVNDVQWLEYDTLHKSLYVTSATDTQYPEAFFVSKKTLSGTIQQYLTDSNGSKVQTWSTNSTLRIRVHNGTAYYLDVNMPKVKISSRLDPGEVFIQNYDFRMTHSPANVTDVLNYNL